MEDPGLAFDVALHLGHWGAVLIYFWKDLLPLAAHVGEPQERNTVTWPRPRTIPGALAGLLLEHKAGNGPSALRAHCRVLIL